jgi:hypothetical protein
MFGREPPTDPLKHLLSSSIHVRHLAGLTHALIARPVVDNDALGDVANSGEGPIHAILTLRLGQAELLGLRGRALPTVTPKRLPASMCGT